MSTVTEIKPQFRSMRCPDLLRPLAGWLVWRYEHHDGEAKPRKVPYYPDGGKRHGVQGRPEDRQRLTSFDAATTAAAKRGMDGVGFCPMPEWGIAALDFDDCVTSGGVHPTVARLVFEPLTERPARLYGDSGSHYQRQGLKLSKHFRMWSD
jgi:primase-polymerase (primpol)-like protein